MKNLLPGGKPGNKGGGRPPDWLKKKCAGLIDRKKLVERLAKIAAGELVDTTTTIDGRIIRIPAPMQAQVKAAQELLDRGFGKAPMSIELPGQIVPCVALLPMQDKGESGGIK